MAFASLFRKAPRLKPVPLYMALVDLARDPWFYTDGAVPDTTDGRYDMMSLMVSLALLRLERDGDAHRAFGQALLETFVADMDESMREAGVGDLGVGRQVRYMAEGFVGRYGAYKAAKASDDWAGALGRNLYRDVAAPPEAMLARLAALRQRFDQTDDTALLAGQIGAVA
jgi:cytochrome b pre-mRNA-processing protein 3